MSQRLPRLPQELTIAHLSDLHLTAPGTLLLDKIETWQRAREAFAAAAAHNPAIFVVTGDISERDQPTAGHVDPFLQEMADQYQRIIVTMPGNHDQQSDFARSIYRPAVAVGAFAQHAGVDRGSSTAYADPAYRPREGVTLGQTEISYGPEPADALIESPELRLIALNTHGYRAAQGHLTDAQHDWFVQQLAAPKLPGQRLVVSLHHPPTPSNYVEVRNIGLADSDRFAAAVAGRGVDAILAGHYHISQAASVAGVPIWVTPAVSYQGDPLAPLGRLRGRDYGYFSLVRFAEDRPLGATACQFAGDGALLFDREIYVNLLP